MIKTLIVDDEVNAREGLAQLLTRYFPQKFWVMAQCGSVEEGIAAVEQFKPELVFLDIQMPNQNGFELIKHFKRVPFEVIFTTAHSHFALEAIKCSALDYLLKPINYLDLADALKRLEDRKYHESRHDRISLLLENVQQQPSQFNRIVLPTATGFAFIAPSTILYAQGDSNYCRIKMADGKEILLSKTLKHLEDLLPNELFFRIHKSYIVNLNAIVQFSRNQDLFVLLHTGEQLPVAVRKKEEFIHAVLSKNV